MDQGAEGYAGKVSWLCCFNIKRFPRGVLQPPSPEVFKPQQQGLSPELSALSRIWDWTLPELPHHLWLLAPAQVTPIPHSDVTTLTSIYSFDTFLLTLQGLPGAWYDICDCAWIKQKTPFFCCQSFPTTFLSTKAFQFDFARFNTLFLIVFSVVGDCWQHSIFLQPAPQALAIHCLFTSKVCCEQLTWKPHCWNFTFFSLNAYKWVKKWSIH